MLSVHLCQIYFLAITFSMVLAGLAINMCEQYLPIFISQTFRYGKFASKQQSALITLFEVPKSYFKHFYLISGVLYYPLLLREVLNVYVFHGQPNSIFLTLLDIFCGSNRRSTASSTRIFIAIILMALQVYRRFYDTQCVSVFSKKATINITHYLIGLTYYPAVMFVILSEAPGFVRHSSSNKPVLLSEIGFTETLAVVLFLWAWYHQHKSTVILANLRKNNRGNIVNEDYQIPEGDWFEYLSSPHSTAEILMYTALTILLYKNVTWWLVYIWVLSCQVESILLSHWWYQSKFKNFPKSRKALIPFVY